MKKQYHSILNFISYKSIASNDNVTLKKAKFNTDLSIKTSVKWTGDLYDLEYKRNFEGRICSITHIIGMNQYDFVIEESNHTMLAQGVSNCIAVAIIVSYEDGSKARYLGHINATKEWVDAGEIGEVEYYPKPSETVAELLDKKVTDYLCLIAGGVDDKDLLEKVEEDVLTLFKDKNIPIIKEKIKQCYQPFKLFPEKGEDEQYVSVGITKHQILILD